MAISECTVSFDESLGLDGVEIVIVQIAKRWHLLIGWLSLVQQNLDLSLKLGLVG